jgi:hypothetical protein
VRIQIEYIEMPGLRLTLAQARRLCDAPHAVCVAALSSLVKSGFLWQAGDGSFVRQGLGHRENAVVEPRLAAAS